MSRSRSGGTFGGRCRSSDRAGTLAKRALRRSTKPGRNAFPAAMLEMPARRISLTSRSCSVRLARSTRPFAWLELAHPDLDLQLGERAAELRHAVPAPGVGL